MILDDAAIPDTLYAFVDESDPMTWNNYNLVGQLTSASYGTSVGDDSDDLLPYIRNPRAQPRFISPFVVRTLSLWGVELDAERVRRQIASDAPSRLSSVFAFGSLEDCESASRMYGWNLEEVRPFRLAEDADRRVSRVNMQIVSLARLAYAKGSLDVDMRDAIWSAYWAGDDGLALELPAPPPDIRREYSSGCLWEYLIYGRLLRCHGSDR